MLFMQLVDHNSLKSTPRFAAAQHVEQAEPKKKRAKQGP
jgi:hypothetical protein